MMLAYNYILPLSLFLLGLDYVSAQAGVTVNLDSGQLTAPTSMQVDNTFPSSNGSLLLLIDLGSSNTLDNTLTPGNYVSGTNTVIAAGGFNTNGGTNETLTSFTIIGSLNEGDFIALRWFPQITFAQYLAGALPVTGDYFGSYNPDGGNPDGGNQWLVPADGSAINLNFFTTNSEPGGSQPPTAGIASSQVTVPSPVSFNSWQSVYFSAQQFNDPTVSGAGATPEHDGVPNLLKYLYDINPSSPMTAADRAALPLVGIDKTTSPGTVYLTLTYRQYAAETGITVNVQTSSDLQNWTTVMPDITKTLSTDPNTGDPLVQVEVNTQGATKQFLRLSVTMP